MRQVCCYECKKTYDYDLHDFCPRCGSYTQPKKHLRFDGSGRIVRVDGINEQNHRGSFVHAERHQEEKQRRRLDMLQDLKATVQAEVKSSHKSQSAAREQKKEGLPLGIIFLILYLLFQFFF